MSSGSVSSLVSPQMTYASIALTDCTFIRSGLDVSAAVLKKLFGKFCSHVPERSREIRS